MKTHFAARFEIKTEPIPTVLCRVQLVQLRGATIAESQHIGDKGTHKSAPNGLAILAINSQAQ